jgi:DNA-binding helix-hairpin-helix protein with protein kinase domain
MATVTLLPGSRNLPNQLTISDKPAHRGGLEGSIFFTSDNRYAVKIYRDPRPDKQQLLQLVLDLGKSLDPREDRFLAWPLGIVSRLNGQPRVGVVTRRVPSSYVQLLNLIATPLNAAEQFRQGRDWLAYLKMARATAAAARSVHGKGLAHGDISSKNVLGDPTSGEAVLIDLDGVVVRGTPLRPQTGGTPRFRAPEVVMGKSQPEELTDRHSLAVLVLWILLLRDVMLPQKSYDEEDDVHSDELAYGQFACFSENPYDRRNYLPRTGIPLDSGGFPSYSSLTPKLQKLTERALIDGLHDPPKRPQAVEWERALAEAYDVLVRCPNCHQPFIYPYWRQPPLRLCPFCGSSVRALVPVVLELREAKAKGTYFPVRPVVLYHKVSLFADITEPTRFPPFTRRDVPIIGQTSWDPKDKVHRLVNTGDTPWQVLSSGSGTIKPGESVPLREGVLFSFGVGKRLARVVE